MLRFVHGFSTGFTPTGGTAYLADVIPFHKRGEAMGIMGTAGTVGMAAGPAIGGTLANQFGLDAMFYCSSFFGLIAIIIVSRIKETLGEKQKFSFGLLKVKKEDIFEPLVILPCLIMVLASYAYGTIFTVIPDLGQFVGIKNKGLLFTFLTVASLLVRLLAGKASDKYGRVEVLRVSTIVIVMAMLIVGMATTPLMLIIGVTLYGFAQGSTSPTLLAWATDLSDDRFKGRGIASLYIFMELGIGLGALCSGWIYGNNPDNFFITFLISGLLSGSAFAYLIYHSVSRTK
jgi:MFS family permease